jgi:hypothetical protein
VSPTGKDLSNAAQPDVPDGDLGILDGAVGAGEDGFEEGLGAAARAIRTPRAAGIAGVVFALMLLAVLVLVRWAVPQDPVGSGDWLLDPSRRRAVKVAMQMVPLAGIAFLWFLGAIRSRFGHMEDRFFATVFLGSGFVFVAMMFATAAVGASLYDTFAATDAEQAEVLWQFGRRTTYSFMVVYSMRMAAVFVSTTTTILLRLRLLPRWLAVFGYLVTVVMLLVTHVVPWLELLFPLWALVLSVHVLITNLREPVAGLPVSPSPG